jgi:hypothetical protein
VSSSLRAIYLCYSKLELCVKPHTMPIVALPALADSFIAPLGSRKDTTSSSVYSVGLDEAPLQRLCVQLLARLLE